MTDFVTTLKDILTRGVNAVSKAANGVVDATKFKMNEMDNASRRREAISELGEKVYGLYQTGIDVPEEIVPLVNEIRSLDETMDAMRSDRAAAKAAAAEQAAADKVAREQARAEARAAAKEAKEAAAAAKAAAAAAAAEAAAQAKAEAEQAVEYVEDVAEEIAEVVETEEEEPKNQ